MFYTNTIICIVHVYVCIRILHVYFKASSLPLFMQINVLRYKREGRGFYSRWGQYDFSLS